MQHIQLWEPESFCSFLTKISPNRNDQNPCSYRETIMVLCTGREYVSNDSYVGETWKRFFQAWWQSKKGGIVSAAMVEKMKGSFLTYQLWKPHCDQRCWEKPLNSLSLLSVENVTKLLFYKEVLEKHTDRKILWGRGGKCHRVAPESSQKPVTARILDRSWHLSGFFTRWTCAFSFGIRVHCPKKLGICNLGFLFLRK